VSHTPNAIVFVIDDEPDVRAALRMLIRSVGLTVETFESATAFLQQYNPAQPGCIITDVRMPGMSGMELQQYLSQQGLAPPMILISGHGEIPMAVTAVKRGAIDFLPKPFSDQLLLDRIQQALQQDHAQRAQHARLASARTRYESLTPRERDVLQGLIAGKINKVIAAELGVSTRTIEIHRAHVMEKLRVDSMPDVMRLVAVLEWGGERVV
jgi:two-component system, LuxR family, response regulator FixJ